MFTCKVIKGTVQCVQNQFLMCYLCTLEQQSLQLCMTEYTIVYSRVFNNMQISLQECTAEYSVIYNRVYSSVQQIK